MSMAVSATLTIGGIRPAALARPTGYAQHAPVSGAIPRTYNGITFRSTTEARFARWFDLLGLTWSYEAEGYTDGVVSAMPDFWLPRFACHLEVKHSDDYNRMKPQAVARVSGCGVLVATSSPWSDPAFAFHRVYPHGDIDEGWRLIWRNVGDDGLAITPELFLMRDVEPDADVQIAASAAGNHRFWNAVR